MSHGNHGDTARQLMFSAQGSASVPWQQSSPLVPRSALRSAFDDARIGHTGRHNRGARRSLRGIATVGCAVAPKTALWGSGNHGAYAGRGVERRKVWWRAEREKKRGGGETAAWVWCARKLLTRSHRPPPSGQRKLTLDCRHRLRNVSSDHAVLSGTANLTEHPRSRLSFLLL
jgi:hypothetical protein